MFALAVGFEAHDKDHEHRISGTAALILNQHIRRVHPEARESVVAFEISRVKEFISM